jgi:hypothetical protein
MGRNRHLLEGYNDLKLPIVRSLISHEHRFSIRLSSHKGLQRICASLDAVERIGNSGEKMESQSWEKYGRPTIGGKK